MNTTDFVAKCKREVISYIFNEWGDVVRDDEVFIVWQSKTLQNMKSTVFVTAYPDHYFEFTYDGNLRRIYMNVYHKVSNLTIIV